VEVGSLRIAPSQFARLFAGHRQFLPCPVILLKGGFTCHTFLTCNASLGNHVRDLTKPGFVIKSWALVAGKKES
jgi:hypothetical protein